MVFRCLGEKTFLLPYLLNGRDINDKSRVLHDIDGKSRLLHDSRRKSRVLRDFRGKSIV